MYTHKCSACGHDNEDPAKFCGICGRDLFVDSERPNLVGTTILERYTIKRLIATGGMGVVYEAEQSLGEYHRTVAIKMLLPELSHDQTVVSRFNRECGIVAQLTHQNTVRVYDFGTAEDGTLYIAMEYVRGPSLAEAISNGPMPVSRALSIVEQMCHALHEAHELGIVHRDLKPDNVILTQHGTQEDVVKLLDFGIAVRISAGGKHETKLTQQGIILGTPPYMSPEQFTGAAVTRQSDLYSLGIILYEILTGKLPFVADSPWMWAQRHLTSKAPELSASFPVAIAATIRASLAKDPALRPGTALEMYQYLTGERNIELRQSGAIQMSGVSRLDDYGRGTTQPDAVPITSFSADTANRDFPGIRTDPAGPPLTEAGTPLYAGSPAPAPLSAEIQRPFADQSFSSPSIALRPAHRRSRGRGMLIGIIATLCLTLTAGGLWLAYWFDVIENPFQTNEPPSPWAVTTTNPLIGQTGEAPVATQVQSSELAPVPIAPIPEPDFQRAGRGQTRATTNTSGSATASGTSSALPSPSSATPGGAASSPPGGFTWPPFLPGFPTSLPSLPTAFPPMPTAIGGIPIPPLFPGAPAAPAPNPSTSSPPSGTP